MGKIPLLRRFAKHKLFFPKNKKEFLSFFEGSALLLEDGHRAIFSKPIKKLIKYLDLERKNVLEFEVEASPDYNERIHVYAEQIFD